MVQTVAQDLVPLEELESQLQQKRREYRLSIAGNFDFRGLVQMDKGIAYLEAQIIERRKGAKEKERGEREVRRHTHRQAEPARSVNITVGTDATHVHIHVLMTNGETICCPMLPETAKAFANGILDRAAFLQENAPSDPWYPGASYDPFPTDRKREE